MYYLPENMHIFVTSKEDECRLPNMEPCTFIDSLFQFQFLNWGDATFFRIEISAGIVPLNLFVTHHSLLSPEHRLGKQPA
jgi:hypothetical protein